MEACWGDVIPTTHIENSKKETEAKAHQRYLTSISPPVLTTPIILSLFVDAFEEHSSRACPSSPLYHRLWVGKPSASPYIRNMRYAVLERFLLHVRSVFTGSLTRIDVRDSWIYASTLAYIVDANNGRSSTAMASNSAFRGISAFAATEIAVPLQVAIHFHNFHIYPWHTCSLH